jgi:hypothetical protein
LVRAAWGLQYWGGPYAVKTRTEWFVDQLQLGEELGAILAGEHIVHYTAVVIATKAEGKNIPEKL